MSLGFQGSLSLCLCPCPCLGVCLGLRLCLCLGAYVCVFVLAFVCSAFKCGSGRSSMPTRIHQCSVSALRLPHNYAVVGWFDSSFPLPRWRLMLLQPITVVKPQNVDCRLVVLGFGLHALWPQPLLSAWVFRLQTLLNLGLGLSFQSG